MQKEARRWDVVGRVSRSRLQAVIFVNMQDAKSLTVRDVLNALHAWAPPSLQEPYDNSGLLVGSPDASVTSVLISLDCTEAVVNEAVAKGAEVIVSHHPVIFKGLKRLTGSNHVQRTVESAIRNGIALIAVHTNLDNVADGVNRSLALQLGLEPRSLQILRPMHERLKQVIIYTPKGAASRVADAMFAAGAGTIGRYDECGFNAQGEGTFRPGLDSNPALGEVGRREQVQELRTEVVVEAWRVPAVLAAARTAHPYEEMAHAVLPMEQHHQGIGAGLVGMLTEPMTEREFLQKTKNTLGCGVIKHTEWTGRPVQRIALCGGAGSFLLSDAIAARADVFVTGDFKYHEFFGAEGQLLIADVGHYESEWHVTEWIHTYLSEQFMEKFTNFALLLSQENPNPVHTF
jgi:dinuclear metal center YbgI/SA1388 family protein